MTENAILLNVYLYVNSTRSKDMGCSFTQYLYAGTPGVFFFHQIKRFKNLNFLK